MSIGLVDDDKTQGRALQLKTVKGKVGWVRELDKSGHPTVQAADAGGGGRDSSPIPETFEVDIERSV